MSRIFPNYHQIASAELSTYFKAKADAIDAETKVKASLNRLKLLGIDPDWRLGEAMNADPDEVFVCEHDGCDRPVIVRSWSRVEKKLCESHAPKETP